MKRERHGARIVLIDPDSRLLLLHFRYSDGPLAGSDYWGLPGGGIETGETPEDGARRELREETGIEAGNMGPLRAESLYDFRLSSGENVLQHDCYFALPVKRNVPLSRQGLTPEETTSLAETRWWDFQALRGSDERIMPPDLIRILAAWPEFGGAIESA